MKTRRHTEEQIAFALKQAETGTTVSEVIRRMGISEQTFYRWKKVYGEMTVSETARLRTLEVEHRRLKKLLEKLTRRIKTTTSNRSVAACATID